jgi:single-stranded-DNA-specific exonuclease
VSAPTLTRRDAPPRAAWALEQAGVPALLARLYAGRGVRDAAELDAALAKLHPPALLRGAREAALRLADAIEAKQRLVIVADYDCDGATACALALRGLARLGADRATLGYVVPDRAVHGYGLTPGIVDLAAAQKPDWLITVDNGIASVEGVAHARARGIGVLITDHHLPAVDAHGEVQLPVADVIVNPNQPGCEFPSKHLAGVGVMFYLLLALRAVRRERGAFGPGAEPRLDDLLDLVALGTVADVVRLDANNRRLVAQGLERVRAGRMQPGVAALFAAAGRDPRRASAFDFGFALGPRINAAGRLADMTIGIECLATDDANRAAELARTLDTINRERREVEGGMRELAEAWLAQRSELGDDAPALAIHDPSFHEGVVGIVAARLKDRAHRPTFVFAPGRDGVLKGSGRSIAGFHLRDALDLIAKRHPGLLIRFGGHAMAAGCTIAPEAFEAFDAAFRDVARGALDAATLERRLLTDGPLPAEQYGAETVRLLDAQVWGAAFEPPLFDGEFDVVAQRLVGEKHLKLTLRGAGEAASKGALREAIWFGRSEPVPARLRLAYRLALDEWNGRERVQMVIEAGG